MTDKKQREEDGKGAGATYAQDNDLSIPPPWEILPFKVSKLSQSRWGLYEQSVSQWGAANVESIIYVLF